jgi:hypothetical protein
MPSGRSARSRTPDTRAPRQVVPGRWNPQSRVAVQIAQRLAEIVVGAVIARHFLEPGTIVCRDDEDAADASDGSVAAVSDDSPRGRTSHDGKAGQ